MSAPSALDIVPLGRAVATSVLYRREGQLYVTIIAKATFTFAPNGTMQLTDPEPILLLDQPLDRDAPAEKGDRAAHDLCPIRERADVLFAGSAFAPQGVPTRTLSVRLALARGEKVILEKVLHIYGDRTPTKGSPSPEPAPFVRMPIVYERAFGGHGSPANPIGVGLWSPRGTSPLPNVVYPDPWQQSGEPAGFLPIPASWPVRARHVGPGGAEALRAPVPAIDAMAPAFFQAAPEDQRIDYLRGDEWILLENLSPLHPRMTMGLPNARAEARIYGPTGFVAEVAMNADTLFLDGDAERCSVTFRGSYPLVSEAQVEDLWAAVGVATLASPIEWDFETIDLSGITADAEKTIEYIANTSPVARRPADHTLTGVHAAGVPSMTLTGNCFAALPSLRAPFPIAKPGEGSPAEPIPGAPWSPVAAEAPIRPSTSLQAQTLVSPNPDEMPEAVRRLLEPPSPPAAEAPPLPAAPEPQASPPQADEKPAWPWASPPPTAEPSGEAKPKVEPRPRPEPIRAPMAPPVNAGLYDKFATKKKKR